MCVCPANKSSLCPACSKVSCVRYYAVHLEEARCVLCVRSAEQFGVCLSLQRHVVWCPQLLWARDILLFARLSLLCDHGKLARDPGEHGPDSGSRWCVGSCGTGCHAAAGACPSSATCPGTASASAFSAPTSPDSTASGCRDDPRVPPNVAPPPHYPGQGPVGESHFLRPCRFCGHTSYWREGVCLSEWCRASWLHLVCFFCQDVCVLCTQIGYCNTDMDLNNVRRWGGQEESLESYRSNVEWARSKRHKVNKGILSNNNCRGEEAFIVSFFLVNTKLRPQAEELVGREQGAHPSW